MTEIEILKKLQHENLPQIIDIFEKNDTYLIIMDYVEGRTLKAIIDEKVNNLKKMLLIGQFSYVQF